MIENQILCDLPTNKELNKLNSNQFQLLLFLPLNLNNSEHIKITQWVGIHQFFEGVFLSN